MMRQWSIYCFLDGQCGSASFSALLVFVVSKIGVVLKFRIGLIGLHYHVWLTSLQLIKT